MFQGTTNKAILLISALLLVGAVYYGNLPQKLMTSLINPMPNTVTLHTTEGDITLDLYADKTPKTVENFVGLAEAGKYDDTIFHRVIEGFMIQGGDYENFNGTGGKSIWGEEFEDEFAEGLTHKRGVISMANRGPATNGSQFFITHAPTPFLDGRHTIFGEVTEGLDIVDAIATTETGAFDKPVTDIKITKITTR